MWVARLRLRLRQLLLRATLLREQIACARLPVRVASNVRVSRCLGSVRSTPVSDVPAKRDVFYDEMTDMNRCAW